MAVEQPQISNEELEEILNLILHNYGYDFTSYARASITRRVVKYMADTDLNSVYNLKYQLVNNSEAFELFLQKITVNVTEMFRDPEYYKTLREEVIPMLASYPTIKIWVAGCATGEEVFSLSILLHEAGLLSRTRFYATDINPANIEKAKKAIIPLELVKEYTTNYFKAGGTSDFADYYIAKYNNAVILNELRKNILFSQHNLVTDQVFNEFQLISCRNVMIYFNHSLQNRVTRLFYDSLSSFGYLTLGIKESLLFSDQRTNFDIVNKTQKIFRRIG